MPPARKTRNTRRVPSPSYVFSLFGAWCLNGVTNMLLVNTTLPELRKHLRIPGLLQTEKVKAKARSK